MYFSIPSYCILGIGNVFFYNATNESQMYWILDAPHYDHRLPVIKNRF